MHLTRHDISRFFDNCKKQIKGKKGFPRFKKHSRSVEYKQPGWKLDETTKKHITFTDKKGIGRLKLVGSRDIYFYQPEEIKRVRLIRRKATPNFTFEINYSFGCHLPLYQRRRTLAN